MQRAYLHKYTYKYAFYKYIQNFVYLYNNLNTLIKKLRQKLCNQVKVCNLAFILQ